MPSLISSTDRDKIKRSIPKNTNKIIDSTIARLYIAYPEPNSWTFTGIVGAVVLVNDLTGNTFFLKIVDIIGNRGVLWDQELYIDFQYNQDRVFFHTFEIEECYAGLLFADDSEAHSFLKKVQHKEKYANKATLNNKNAIAVKKKPTAAAQGPRGDLLRYQKMGNNYTLAPIHDNIESDQKSIASVDSAEDSEYKKMLETLGELGITQDMLSGNPDAIKEKLAKVIDVPKIDKKSKGPPPPPPLNPPQKSSNTTSVPSTDPSSDSLAPSPSPSPSPAPPTTLFKVPPPFVGNPNAPPLPPVNRPPPAWGSLRSSPSPSPSVNGDSLPGTPPATASSVPLVPLAPLTAPAAPAAPAAPDLNRKLPPPPMAPGQKYAVPPPLPNAGTNVPPPRPPQTTLGAQTPPVFAGFQQKTYFGLQPQPSAQQPQYGQSAPPGSNIPGQPHFGQPGRAVPPPLPSRDNGGSPQATMPMNLASRPVPAPPSLPPRQPLQSGVAPQFGQTMQFSQAPQFNQIPPVAQSTQYGQPTQYTQPTQYAQPTQYTQPPVSLPVSVSNSTGATPPPPPPHKHGSRTAPPPPPAPFGSNRQQTASSRAAAVPPTPPQPYSSPQPQPYATPYSTANTAALPSRPSPSAPYNGAPATNVPPPPPPPPSFSQQTPPAPPPPPPMGGSAAPLPVAGGDDRGSLMASIRGAGGIHALKKVDKGNLERPLVVSGQESKNGAPPPLPSGGGDNLQSAIAAALSKRKNQMNGYDDTKEDW
ncbi:uncharacterized protein V1516DRAFT_655993 [Lipomyces oligophaga]|uniref:uncharacterized protein n=1 Tax=Lipomyces oligophaga TaxID=45792 RepID=UPI0034CEBD2F